MSGGLLPVMPRQAAMTVNDLLDNCAEVKSGQQVVIVAAFDGLAGGANLVDETAIAWLQAGVHQRGAQATVISPIFLPACTIGVCRRCSKPRWLAPIC